jgi:hypothetical protein
LGRSYKAVVTRDIRLYQFITCTTASRAEVVDDSSFKAFQAASVASVNAHVLMMRGSRELALLSAAIAEKTRHITIREPSREQNSICLRRVIE